MNVFQAEENYILPTIPQLYDNLNGSCSCATSSTCSRQLLFILNSKTIILPFLSDTEYWYIN